MELLSASYARSCKFHPSNDTMKVIKVDQVLVQFLSLYKYAMFDRQVLHNWITLANTDVSTVGVLESSYSFLPNLHLQVPKE